MRSFDPSAPTESRTDQRLDSSAVAGVMAGAKLICSTEQDNDSEFFYLTRAGQVVRVTGLDQDRFYVYDRDDHTAKDMLVSLADDTALAMVWSDDEIAEYRLPEPGK